MSKVYTVLGPINPDEIGACDMHEHVLWSSPGWEYSPEAFGVLDRPRVFEKIRTDLLEYASLGGRTVVDVSGIGIGRDIGFYSDLSRETGVHIVACTGFWAEQKILPYFQARDLDYMTELFVHELTKGMGTTSVRAGIIKVGTSRDKMTPIEERTFCAAARASRKTGAAVTTHGVHLVERQVEVLLDEGVDPTRVVIGHLDDGTAIDPERDKHLAHQGFYLGYDHIGIEPDWSSMHYAISDERRADLVVHMIEAGFIDQVVLACDTNAWAVGLAHRGTPKSTYAHLLRSWVPRLKSRGVTDEQIQTMLVATPRAILPF